MSGATRKTNAFARLARASFAVVVAITALVTAPAVTAKRSIASGEILVARVEGEAHLTQRGSTRRPLQGQIVDLPATVRTGRDGTVDLTQGATTLSVAPDSTLEFPAAQDPRAPVERVVQSSGNAFYDIAKRDTRKLRVETPFLVAVVKGTQFSVTVQQDATSISLVEGSLEIHATDGGATVDLEAGQIATRRRGESVITVVSVDEPRVRTPGGVIGTVAAATDATGGVVDGAVGANAIVAAGSRGQAGGTAAGVAGGVDAAGNALSVGATGAMDLRAGAVNAEIAAGTTLGPVAGAGAEVSVALGGTGVDAAVGAQVDVTAGPLTADVGANVSAGVGAGGVDLGIGAGANVSAGPVGVDLGAGLTAGVGAGGVDLGANLDTGVSAGPVGVDLGSNVTAGLGAGGVNLGVDTGASVSAGPVTTDLGLGLGADLGTGGAGVDLGTSVDVGTPVVDLGASAGGQVDLGLDSPPAAQVDAGLDLGTPAGNLGAGVSAGADLGAGTIDLGLNVVGVEVDLGIDLGLDDENETPEVVDTGTNTGTNTNTGGGTLVDNVGNVLDGLLRPRRR